MVSDSVVNASIPNASKDFGKKKRANRSAKLKQCKLDARREQWLSQVKNHKGCEEELSGGQVLVHGELNGPTTRKKAPILKDLELKNPCSEEIEIHHDSDSESSSSHANSPMSSLSGGNNSGINYSGSSSCSSSSISSSSFGFSCGGSCSGNEEEEDEEEEEEGGGGDGDGNGNGNGNGDDGCLDDWEVMADALTATTNPNNKQQGDNPNTDLPPNHENGSGFGSGSGLTTDASSPRSKPDGLAKTRAWRPDDASRPQCLPNLSKQRSFPVNLERHSSCHIVNSWVRSNVPSSCPICCEDLDLTDSSFLPCACGFRLCLFCHKRILEEDGRCPGCRKPYVAADPVEKEASVSEGGGLTVRLARSCSMFSRV